MKPTIGLTFANCADAAPGAVVLANACGGAGEVVALGTSEVNLMPDKVLGAKLGTKSRGSQRGAAGGSCKRGEKSKREMQVTCGASLPTSSGILRPGTYTCHWAVRKRLEKIVEMLNLQSHSNGPTDLQQQPGAAAAAAAPLESCTFD